MPTDDEGVAAGPGIMSSASAQDLALNSPGKNNAAIMSGLDRGAGGSRNKDTLRTADNSLTAAGIGSFPPVN